MLSLSLVSTQLGFFLFCCFSFFNTNYAAKETDGSALLALKAHITSDPLGVLSSWNSSIHFCHWHGVQCSKRRPRVTVLDLHSQQLAGSLPTHIGNLSFLQVLNLTQNNFISSIPPQICNLLRLKILNLGTNSFEGQVPGNISKCSNLIYLGLYSNSLTGPIPPELGSLQQLQRFVVHNNSLSGPIPLSFGNLSSIQVLSAALNSLEGSIPSTLGQLKSLSFLGLGANNLSGTIPASIYNLTSITLFSIPVNRIHGTLPTDLGLHKFPKLETLNIHTNHFSGRIPRSIANATTLREIKIQFNQFIGEVPSFASLRNLEVLTLGQNSFGTGEDEDLNFLPSLANCTNLQILNIDDCNFGGSLPPSLSNFSTNLQKITVAENHIHGTIPLALGNLINLDALGMEMNQLSGAIPSSLGKLNKLGELYLGDNMLSGKIPSSLGNLTSLMSLSLVANNLEGPIPSSLGQYMYLERMRLSDNKLSGAIPEEGILEENEQVIAVKVLDLQFRGASRSFVAECQALRGIRHRNLVKILTACSSIDFQRNDFKALVFEYMPNGSLEEWLHPVSIADWGAEGAKNLSFYKRVDIAIDVACALNYLHHCCHTPIVHCDLKPSNVLLDSDMTACVGDFGLARFLSQGTQASSANESSTLGLKGSIGYIAPEYGMGSEVSTYGDVYSYGILVLEMLTGKRPTDSMFEDGLDLRQFVVSALASHEVTQFVDPILNVGGENANTKNYPTASKQTSLDVEDCLISILGIGIACSAKSPSERSDIRNVVDQLNHTREVLLGTRLLTMSK